MSGQRPPAPVTVPVPAGGAPRGRARSVVLGTVMALGFGLCALVTGTSIGLSAGALATVVGLLFAIVPLGIVVPAFAWVDRYESEPTRHLVAAFAWGAVVATAIALVLNTGSMALLNGLTHDDPSTAVAVGVAPVVEESTKGLGLLLAWRLARDEMDGIVDGIVYGGIIAAGFAFAENILYLGRAFSELGAAGLVATFVLRGLFGPFAHPLFTACTGIGVGIAATSRRSGWRWGAPVLGWLCAVGLHSLWNLTAVAGAQGWLSTFIVLQVPIFVAFVALTYWARAREGRVIAANLARYAQAGWFTPAEVAMVSSLSGRRQALAWARAVGGPTARTAMERFQDDATSLALLRVRLDTGDVTPTTGPRREREAQLLRDLTAVRPVAMSWHGQVPGRLPGAY